MALIHFSVGKWVCMYASPAVCVLCTIECMCPVFVLCPSVCALLYVSCPESYCVCATALWSTVCLLYPAVCPLCMCVSCVLLYSTECVLCPSVFIILCVSCLVSYCVCPTVYVPYYHYCVCVCVRACPNVYVLCPIVSCVLLCVSCVIMCVLLCPTVSCVCVSYSVCVCACVRACVRVLLSCVLACVSCVLLCVCVLCSYQKEHPEAKHHGEQDENVVSELSILINDNRNILHCPSC